MKITILDDNTAGNECKAEHGLSYLIESDLSFLFDTGPSDVIFRNAEKLGLNLKEIKTIVLSHRHYDHSNGLLHFNGQKLIFHPAIFDKNYRKKDGSYIGMYLTRKEVEARFDIIESREPLFLSKNVVFLGEIPRRNNFEAETTGFVDKTGDDDFILDDTGVAIKTENGLVIISGCAHSGICNIVEHALEVTGEKKIHAVLGGFHLKDNGNQTQKTIEYFKSKQIKNVIPSHCTELPALAAFYKEWPFRQIKSGQVLQF
ncbi:MAG: MBL fold metallo-hydrolase [Mariniphaga sp.]|nr:MBL fold metallo-hydrolase [Mariniphaga sp.]